MEETSALLESWGVSQEVIESFRENEITIESFKDLNDNYLKELCPHMGQRIKLKNNIQDLLDSYAETETAASSVANSTVTEESTQLIPLPVLNADELRPLSASLLENNQNDTMDDLILIQGDQDNTDNLTVFDNLLDKSNITTSFDIDSLLNKNRISPPEFDIKTLLQTSAHGTSVLNYYKQYNTLNAKKRNILVDIVIKHIYTYVVHNNLKPEDYNLLAAKIVAAFPSESVNTYYMRAVPTLKSSTGKYIPAKGKLVDKVRNLLYISETKRRTTKISTGKENELFENENENVPETSDDAIWLKSNSEPWDEVVNKWEKTFIERQKSKLATVHEYLEKWPILKTERGHSLINLDFEKLYKNQSLNFFKYWDSFFVKLLNSKKSEITNENALQILDIYNAVTETDKKIPLQMTLLGYLVPPKGRLSRKVKFSSAEAIEGLIVQTNNAGDIENIIQKQNDKAASHHLTVQPYVLVVGKLHDFSALYIVIDDIRYEIRNAAKAFDLLFKIYHVFHAKYPLASSHLYLIIQRKIYNITTQYDIVPPHIIEILNM